MTTQQQFAAKVQQLIAQSKNLSLDARKKILEILDATRKEIIVRLAGLNPESFTAAQLNVLKNQISSLMDQFGRTATTAIDGFEEKSLTLGSQMVSQPLSTVGLETPSLLGGISSSALSVVQGYTADLITALSKDASAKINGAIQRGFLGDQPITDIIRKIGGALDPKKGFDGLFGPIGKRATAIAMNEIGRVHSIATQARLEDAADRHPDLQKQWNHLAIALVPRPGHIAADGQVVDVDQPFIVEGEELMYPRDPNGSPENTIGCHCIQSPFFDESALKPTAAQKGLLDSLGISVSAA